MGLLQSGFILIRPCAATAQHMLKLARSSTLLQFPYTTAEQEFLGWYVLGWYGAPYWSLQAAPRKIPYFHSSLRLWYLNPKHLPVLDHDADYAKHA